jgi:Ring finger domain
MHINAMAAIWRLKVEAKDRGMLVQESDCTLLANSCRLYLESIALTEANATPTLAIGDASLSGSQSFFSPVTRVRNGKGSATWTDSSNEFSQPWVAIEFDGAPRKITQVRLRSIAQSPQFVLEQHPRQGQRRPKRPKECVLQVTTAALGGAFVDVARFLLPDSKDSGVDSAWVCEGGFRTNKSKSWRICVVSFYGDSEELSFYECDPSLSVDCSSLEFELYEADIASDPLQRLHSLHNAAHTFELLLEHDNSQSERDAQPSSILKMSSQDMKSKVGKLRNEAAEIESLYMEVTRATHAECMRRLLECSSHRQIKVGDIMRLNSDVSSERLVDVWDDWWWDDFLALLLLKGKEMHHEVFEKLLYDLNGVIQKRMDADSLDRDKIKFPEFESIDQFRTALILRMKRIRSGLGNDRNRKSRVAASASADITPTGDPFTQARSTRFQCAKGQHNECMNAISKLSAQPPTADVYENAHCHVCKADWFQTGPKCSHCKLHDVLRDLAPDQVTVAVLASIHGMIRSPLGASLLRELDSRALIAQRAKLFFDVLEAEKREKAIAYRAWRVHLDLLNDLDELSQCKSSMRLTYEGEDVTQLTSDQLNAIVEPFDLNARFQIHAGKQVMTHGELRRAKDTLRYLRNLDQASSKEAVSREGSTEADTCVVCLSTLREDQVLAVLNCGHRFHHDPCLAQLKARRTGSHIRCPMRCRQPTPADSVLLAFSNAASSLTAEDGATSGTTGNARSVRGSWGTKVSRLVRDVLDIRDTSEKGVVFSQWEDMLNIVQQALEENRVECVRPSSAKRIGDAVRRFRSDTCTVLLLNVKNGGEGLTLLEATHVFMVEPLLNSGLDSQGTTERGHLPQRPSLRRSFIFDVFSHPTHLVSSPVQRSIGSLGSAKRRRRTCGGT